MTAVTSNRRSDRQSFAGAFVLFLCFGLLWQLARIVFHLGHDSVLSRLGQVLVSGLAGGAAVALYEWRWRRRQRSR
jgi:hypothetical protein